MTLTKTKTCLITALVLASVVTSFVIQHQAQAKLGAQDESLRQWSEQLAQLVTDNERLSKLATQANGSADNGRLDELQKLRTKLHCFAGKPRNWPRSGKRTAD
jgi:hypothetical protein